MFLLGAMSALAANWWVEEAADTDTLDAELAELWPGEHRIRVGGGEGYVLREDTLTWVGSPEGIREAPVEDSRQAVALARSWSVERPDATLGWVPDLPPAPVHERTWVLEDLDWGTPGTARFGVIVGLDTHYRGGLEFTLVDPLRARLRATLGSLAFYEPSIDTPGLYEDRARFALELQVGRDLLPSGWLLAPGAVLESQHQIVGSRMHFTAGLGMDLGHVWERRALWLRAETPALLLTSGKHDPLEPTSTELGLAYAQGRLVRWEAHLGGEVRHGAPRSMRTVGVFGTLLLAVDLGGQG